MAYVYRHIRLDSMTPFYIGVGSDDLGKYTRSKNKSYRNKHWHGVVNKHGYRVDIVMDDITWEEALSKEIELISLYGRLNLNTGILVNLTDGGESGKGYIPTEETKRKRAITIASQPKRKLSDKHMQILKNHIPSEYARKRASECHTGRKHTEKAVENMRAAQKKRIFTPEHREKIRQTNLRNFANGTRKPSVISELGMLSRKEKRKNFKHSEDTKIKMSISAKARKKISEETREKLRNKKPVILSKEIRALIGLKNKLIKLNELRFKIVVRNLNGDILGKFRSYEETAREMKVSPFSVSQVINGVKKSVSGYTYAREDFKS